MCSSASPLGATYSISCTALVLQGQLADFLSAKIERSHPSTLYKKTALTCASHIWYMFVCACVRVCGLVQDFGEYQESYYSVQTTEGEQISQLIAGYIDIILKKASHCSTWELKGQITLNVIRIESFFFGVNYPKLSIMKIFHNFAVINSLKCFPRCCYFTETE